ncbi:MAG TPA: LPS export ABC transporter periplasmic protein LptC [Candidatus Omnitrophota bacterium]|nr:LPS export ABC transporter periplasmic protein LptC [Candidatus Omnitrophota bacterium]HPT06790.1 LPS export ABC transporter periplasmic protein LptC [Candidatus Omnitrophota bacterium]
MMYKKVILVIIGFISMVSVACAAVAQKPQQESDQQINDFSLSGYGERGKKTWDLSGKSADIFDDTVKLKDITGNMFGEKENVRLTADKGDFNKAQGTVHLEKNVVITTTSGATLMTESLNWDRQKELVTTPDKVQITKESMVTTATGAKGEPGLNKMTLEKDVVVTIQAQPKGEVKKTGGPALDQPVTVTCDGAMEVDYGKNIARFNTNVKADKGDSVIFCDVLELYFGKDTKKETRLADAANPMAGSSIDKIVCLGNVKIVRGQNVSYSEEAVYSALDQKITLTGKPKLVIYSTSDFQMALNKK